jgi:hypothetical protein
LKFEYPESWASAFHDLMALSQKNGLRTADVLLGVLQEFEIEVVAFNETRSNEENHHNTLIKDTMRHTNIPNILVDYLCGIYGQVVELVNQNPGSSIAYFLEVGKKALICLSELISWVDINLILNNALPVIYDSIEKYEFSCVAGLICIRELLKKGMDIISRIDIIHNIQIQKLLKFIIEQQVTLAYNKIPKYRNEYDENVYQLHFQIGFILDIILLELYTFWIKLEEITFPLNGNTGVSSHQSPEISATRKSFSSPTLNEISPEKLKEKAVLVGNILHSFLPLVLEYLSHPCITLGLTITPSVNKFIQILKLQKSRIEQYQQNYYQLINSNEYFISYRYLESFLSILLKQSYYPVNFDFTVEDDDDNQEFIEVILISCLENIVLFVSFDCITRDKINGEC